MNDFLIELAVKLNDVNALDELEKIEKKLNKKGISLKTVLDSSATKQEAQHLSVEIQKLLKELDIPIDIDSSNIEKSLNQIIQRINSTSNKINKIQIGIEDKSYEVQIENLKAGFKKMGLSADEAEKKIGDVRSAYQQLVNATEDEKIKAFDNFNGQLTKCRNQLKINKAEASEFVSIFKVIKLSNEIQSWLKNNTNATKEAKEEMRDYLQTLQAVISGGGQMSSIEFNTMTSNKNSIIASMREQGRLGSSFSDTIKAGMSKFLDWTIASGGVMAAFNTLRRIPEEVKALDSSLVELSKVSDLSATGLANVTEEAYELGERVSKTGTDVLGAITNFKRAGYDISDSMIYAEEALKTTNISENLKDAGQAASSLVNIMKGYQNESPEFAKKINDAVNQVSNTEAVDFDNLIDGSTRLSAVANQAGMSFEQMLGTLTGAYEILGNMEKSATGQITIFSRLQAIQLDGEEEVSTVAKLQETFSNATKGAVNIVDQQTGQLRNVYDILDDTAEAWDSLDKNTREALAIEAAGIRQKNVFLALMQNWEGVEDAVKSATNSMGSADEENKKYLDSIEGRTKSLESAFQQLAKDSLNSDFFKGFISAGTGVIKVLDAIIRTVGTMPLVSSGIVAFLGRDKSNKTILSYMVAMPYSN